MKNIKLIIEYDGTNYKGWQSQEKVLGIQEVLEKNISSITCEKIKLIGSGRTDGGVHAFGQVANFFTESGIPGDKYKLILNNILPEDIRIQESMEVELDFHSRFSAKAKRYRYRIYNEEIPSAIYRNYSYHYKYPIDIDKMKEASKYFIGKHDFAAFKGRRSVVKSTIRTIYDLKIEKNEEFIDIIIFGNSFLRFMVRIIVGTLIDVSTGMMDIEDIPRIIESKDRNMAGRTAPSQGLFLEKVFYE